MISRRSINFIFLTLDPKNINPPPLGAGDGAGAGAGDGAGAGAGAPKLNPEAPEAGAGAGEPNIPPSPPPPIMLPKFYELVEDDVEGYNRTLDLK